MTVRAHISLILWEWLLWPLLHLKKKCCPSQSVENSHSHKWCFGKVPQWSNNQQHVALAVNRDIC